MSCVCQKECIKRGQWKKRYIQIYWDFKKYIDIKIDKTLSKVTKLLPSIIFDHTLFLEIWRDVDIWSYPPKTLISQTFQFFPQLRSWPLCFFPKIDGQVLFCPNPKVVLKSIITETNVYAQLPTDHHQTFMKKRFVLSHMKISISIKTMDAPLGGLLPHRTEKPGCYFYTPTHPRGLAQNANWIFKFHFSWNENGVFSWVTEMAYLNRLQPTLNFAIQIID